MNFDFPWTTFFVDLRTRQQHWSCSESSNDFFYVMRRFSTNRNAIDRTNLPANATLASMWFPQLHAVSNSNPAQSLLLKLCRKPIVMRPDSRFGLWKANEIVDLSPKYSSSPKLLRNPEVNGNAPVCTLVSILKCGFGWYRKCRLVAIVLGFVSPTITGVF